MDRWSSRLPHSGAPGLSRFPHAGVGLEIRSLSTCRIGAGRPFALACKRRDLDHLGLISARPTTGHPMVVII